VLRGQLWEAGLPEDFTELWDWIHGAVTRLVKDEQAPAERKRWALLMSKTPIIGPWSVFVGDRATLNLLDYWMVATADTPINAVARLALAIHRGKPEA
jgi:hypothetical protein